jgi:uncharacterized protein (TIGR02001 family)
VSVIQNKNIIYQLFLRGILMKKLLLAATTAAIMTGAGTASAIEISGNVGMATDYVFRGQSQTGEEAAISGGFDLGFDSGLYVGTWASNVNYGDGATAEMDFYVGYGFDVSEDITLDFSLVKYVYPGNQTYNYEEYIASTSLYGLDVTVLHSPEYLGDGGESFMYYNLGYGFDLPYDIALGLNVGLNDSDGAFIGGETGDDDYVDYAVSLSKEVYGVEWGVTYYDTDIDGDVNELADARFVLSISKSL